MRAKTYYIVLAIVLSGCAGEQSYVRPTVTAKPNTKVINSPREQVWARAVPELGKRFFTINNLDQSSGLINISYSGDPERYVDCGVITSYVKNARGERTYNFPAAKSQQTYEIMENGQLRMIDRRMSLEGRVNVIFEQVGPNQTRVTANTRYVLTRTQHVSDTQGRSANLSDTVGVNSGSTGTIAAGGKSIDCVPTGELEADLLSAIQ